MRLPCYEYALTLLSYNPKSEAMLRKQLLAKGYDLTQVDRTVQTLQGQNYINDHAFCTAYFESEVINKGKSLNAIKKKMYEKWIDKDLMNQVIEELWEELESTTVTNLAKEIRKLSNQWHDIIKIYEKLARKWHRYDDIKGALEYINEENEN